MLGCWATPREETPITAHDHDGLDAFGDYEPLPQDYDSLSQTDPEPMDTARSVLRDVFGHADFRPAQATLVQAVLAGERDVVGVMPTGAGKSLVYQVPALVLPGLTVVISPLISLMADQVAALRQNGVAAACLTSAQSAREQFDVFDTVRAGMLKLLYVAPERLDDPRFANAMAEASVSLVAVDEAHCISQWGQDFRPSYLAIAGFVDGLAARPRVCALTATATARVRDDIVAGLRLRDAFVQVSGFDRPNLYFGLERPEPRDKMRTALRLVRERVARGQVGIVYCATRKAVEEVHAELVDHGIAAARYHAGLPASERTTAQEDFSYDRVAVMVATNAFGMGIDKSNVGFVIHYNMPGDLESYYQEAGRAGRDGEPADCILIYNKGDVQTRKFLIEKSYEDAIERDISPAQAAAARDADLERLRLMTFYCTTTDCLRSTILRYFGQTDAPFRCEHCSNCSTDYEEEDVTVEAQKVLSCVLRLGQRGRTVGKATIVDILRGSKAQKLRDMRLTDLSTYGIMADASTQRVRYVLDALVDAGLLGVADGQYPTVYATQETMPFLRERRPFTLKVPRRMEATQEQEETRRGRRGRGAQGTGGAPSGKVFGAGAGDEPRGEVDPDLFESLRVLRAELARDAGVPAYLVFSNATLADMCRRRPQTIEELLQVSGVGQAKAARYGDAFLEALRRR